MTATTLLNLSALLTRFCCENVTLVDLAAECGMPPLQLAYMLREHANHHGQTATYEQAINRTHTAKAASRAAEQAAREASRARLAREKLMLLTACEAWAEWLEHRRRCTSPTQCAVEVDRLCRAERLNRRALAAVGEADK